LIEELKRLTAAAFDTQVGQAFSTRISEEEILLELTEVTRLGAGERDGGAFSLVFEGPQAPLATQGTYRLLDSNDNALDLFLVPINQTETASYYEAVFT